MTGILGRVDLLRILLSSEKLSEERAYLLGYEVREVSAPGIIVRDNDRKKHLLDVEHRALDEVSFYVPTLFERREIKLAQAPKRQMDETGLPKAEFVEWKTKPKYAPGTERLGHSDAIAMRLERQFREQRRVGETDTGKLIDQVVRGGLIERIEQLRRPVGCRAITILFDLDMRAYPYRDDFRGVLAALKHLMPATTFNGVGYHSRSVSETIETVRQLPASNALLFVGSMSPSFATFWLRLGAFLKEGGRDRYALSVCRSVNSLDMEQLWTVSYLSKVAFSEETTVQTEKLLVLLSHADQLPVDLIRAMRLEFFPHSSAGLEEAVWSSSAITSRHTLGGTFHPGSVPSLQKKFSNLTLGEKQRSDQVLRSFKYFYPPEVRFKEVASYGKQAKKIVSEDDFEDTESFLEDIAARVASKDASVTGALKTWLMEFAVSHKDCPGMWENHSYLNEVVAELSPSAALTTDPQLTKGSYSGIVSIKQRGEKLVFVPDGGTSLGSEIGRVESGNGHIEVFGIKPAWADASGYDRYGIWADIEVHGVIQRLRWIPSGSFHMGSPAREKGRFDTEGPQQHITFKEGFWLFDTAVTNAFWNAVMKRDGAEQEADIRLARYPKCHVSWHNAQAFIEKLRSLKDSFDIGLPSEAQWEYACRAGTQSAYFFGKKAHDKDIHFSFGNTIEVDAKPANAWGLYQMHGNVREWCSDVWSTSHEGADLGGRPRQVSEEEKEVYRVVRGGSWGSNARYCRSACRRRDLPAFRDVNLGFRCASVQASKIFEQYLEDIASMRVAEPSMASKGSCRYVKLTDAFSSSDLKGKKAPFIIRSDRFDLRVDEISKKHIPWATDLGRDQFGLWAGCEIGTASLKLRWIPPGRFLMGSPSDEVGRSDDEGPQQEITIGAGFWLMDTPVTQVLYEEITGENPSYFKSWNRPVETVSWDNAQGFIEKINDRLESLRLGLPSEARWEYACRSGSRTATYAGDMQILGERNAEVLNEIAWYGGNSGVGFELENGFDSSGWSEKAFEHERAGSRNVRGKQPNGWGCYDMLGNVWEWCSDIWSVSHEGADREGRPRQVSEEEKEVYRVVRGGSWNLNARPCRSAYRTWNFPANRLDFLGFRCASVQAGE